MREVYWNRECVLIASPQAKVFRASIFAEELDGRRARQKSGLGASLDQLFYGLPALFAVPERPFVYIHADKLIGQFGIPLAGELHCLVQGLLSIFEAIRNAGADRLGDLPRNFPSKR